MSTSAFNNTEIQPSETSKEASSHNMARIAQRAVRAQERVLPKERSMSLWHRVPKSRVILQKYRSIRSKPICFAAADLRKCGLSDSTNKIIEHDVSKCISQGQILSSHSFHKHPSHTLFHATTQGYPILIGCQI